MIVTTLPACGNACPPEDLSAPIPLHLNTVTRWLQAFMEPGQVTELVALGHKKGGMAGFYDYDHLPDMARTAVYLSTSGHYKGVYFRFNPINPALLTRSPDGLERVQAGFSASDANILGRRWLLIDADPQRPCDGSATNEEKARAWTKILEVRNFLEQKGWSCPVLADSGNGYHLLYAIDLPAENGGIVKNVLRALAGRFDDGGVVIDQRVRPAPPD